MGETSKVSYQVLTRVGECDGGANSRRATHLIITKTHPSLSPRPVPGSTKNNVHTDHHHGGSQVPRESWGGYTHVHDVRKSELEVAGVGECIKAPLFTPLLSESYTCLRMARISTVMLLTKTTATSTSCTTGKTTSTPLSLRLVWRRRLHRTSRGSWTSGGFWRGVQTHPRVVFSVGLYSIFGSRSGGRTAYKRTQVGII